MLARARLVRGAVSEPAHRRNVMHAVLLVVSLLLVVVGQLTAKYGAGILHDGFERWPVALPFLALAYGALLTRGLVWIVVLRRVALSVAFPVIALSYVAILGASRVIFGEQIGALKIIGAFLIIAGVSVLGVAKLKAKNGATS